MVARSGTSRSTRRATQATCRCGRDPPRGHAGQMVVPSCVPKHQARHPDVVLAPVLRSSAMQRLDGVLRTVAGKDVVLTLIGESGTGKEVLARRAHELSSRRTGPFIPINSAAVPDALFESEFFGHERGAFTGASERMKGKVEAAETGTLFLDEIGEMPLAMQVKMLRFLENRRYMRV